MHSQAHRTHIHKTVTHVNASQKQIRKRTCIIINLFGFNSYKKKLLSFETFSVIVNSGLSISIITSDFSVKSFTQNVSMKNWKQ